MAVTPCVRPAMPPPAITAAVHFTIGGTSVITAADTTVPATKAAGVAKVSSRLSIKVRQALGGRCAGMFDRMPMHTPRAAVIEATEAARAAQADLIVTIGGGSITDGGKAVQMCLANDIRSPEAIDKLHPVKGADGIVGPPPMNTPTVRQISVPTTLSAGDFSALAGVTNERTKTKELLR